MRASENHGVDIHPDAPGKKRRNFFADDVHINRLPGEFFLRFRHQPRRALQQDMTLRRKIGDKVIHIFAAHRSGRAQNANGSRLGACRRWFNCRHNANDRNFHCCANGRQGRRRGGVTRNDQSIRREHMGERRQKTRQTRLQLSLCLTAVRAKFIICRIGQIGLWQARADFRNDGKTPDAGIKN